MTQNADVVVVGGGLAGLSAAAHLVPAQRVTVVEAAAELGGQCAGGWNGDRAVDLGVHGIYPRYTELEKLLTRCSAPLSTLISAAGQYVLTPDGVVSPVRMPRLPAPFNGLLHSCLLTGVDARERVELLLSATHLLGAEPESPHLEKLSMQEFATRAGVPKRAFRMVFEPLSWIGFFLSPDEVSASAYLSALRFLILGRSDSWQARWIPTPNGETLVRPIASFIERHGGRLLVKSRATALVSDGKRIAAVRVTGAGGESHEIPCRAAICALPPPAAAELVATIPGPASADQTNALRALGTTSVQTLRLHYTDGPAPDIKHGVALTERAGFVFLALDQIMPAFRGRRVIEIQCGPEVMAEGEGELLSRVRKLLKDGDRAQLRSMEDTGKIPYSRYAVGSAALRPGIFSPWLNLFFAGDWVHEPGGAWFMERAVRTGRSAAHAVQGKHIYLQHPEPLEGMGIRISRSLIRNVLRIRP
jgi:uncharacterized protein with NAD-binding domain and iron-sulfur cluster